MKKLFLLICLLSALPAAAQKTRAVAAYDAAAAKTAAQNDLANWMSYLPDDVFVAHVSIPGTHDTTTGHGFNGTGIIAASIHASNSQTQAVTLDEQLAGGVRAFDFRPGLSSDKTYLNCNHGISPTKISMNEAFTKLTDYLDAHPGEFFIIHLFRGNVYSGDAPMYAYDSNEDKAKYNQLFDEFFNKGKFSNYIVDYSPYLKVKDIRGKMVIFRRDRIDFAHVAKAGNLSGWPSDTENWTENSRTTVVHASDPTVKGQVTVTDISNPETDELLQRELTSITNINAFARTQTRPNEAKRQGYYKPLWVMCFTSGENGSGRTGYLKNATHTNPHLTNLIKESDVKGPAGIVFSDWVLTDSHDGYATMGVELIPTIIGNNFDYIDQFILDDELFKDNEQIVENYWEDGQQYFIRNAATGEFLSSGATWGTHASLKSDPIRITPVFDKNNNCYTFVTTQGYLGLDTQNGLYVDFGVATEFKAIYSGSNNYFYLNLTDNNGKESTLTATPSTDWFDGTTHIVNPGEYVESNSFQQWEFIKVEDYFNNEIEKASMKNGIDISYMVRGHRFLPGDKENWTGTTHYKETVSKKIHASYIETKGTDSDNDKNLVLHCHNTESNSTYNSNTVWSFTHTDKINKAGVYKLRFKAAHYNFNLNESTLTFKVNGQDVKSKLNSIASNDAALAVKSFREKPSEYTIELDLILDENGEITFEASKLKTNSITGFFLDDIELIYYGPDPSATCDFLQKVVDDATAKVSTLPENLRNGWEDDMKPYKDIIASRDIIGDGSSEAIEIYDLLRNRVIQNTVEGADFTGAIINNSFELGTDFGWNLILSDDTGVKPNSNGTYTANNTDGDYLFNTWSKGTPLTQTIPGLPAGHYKLQALAVTGDTPDPRYVYLLGGSSHSEALQINVDKVTFKDVEYEFDVPETEDVTIGILGAKENGSYDEFGGFWYKADNFRLTYMGAPRMDSFYDFLRKAIDMATARVNMIPEEYRTGWTDEIAPYEKIITDRTLEGDATKEANEIYTLMRAHVYSQNFAGADFTPAITNNSFEWGNTYGWTVANPTGDTGIKENSNATYHAENCDGSYLFNTWNGNEYGSPINQTLPSLPAGKYRLETMVASDQNNRIWITANDFRHFIQVPSDKTVMHNVALEFTIDNAQDVTIGAVGGTNTGTYWKADGGNWYKADNFRLTYLSPLEQTVIWTMEDSKYDTIILPFGVESGDMPESLNFYSADSFDANGTSEYQVLAFGSEELSLQANTPYFVMRAASEPASRSVVAIDDNTYEFTGIPVESNGTDLHNGLLTGVLADTDVEAGNYTLAHDGGTTSFTKNGGQVKAYHAYIRSDRNTNATAPVIYFETPDKIGTGIEEIAADNRPVNVYTPTGVIIRRNVAASKALEGLDPGLYILSDGSRIRKTDYVKLE